MKYIVYDSYGNFIKQFQSYREASEFLTYSGRYDWTIKEY